MVRILVTLVFYLISIIGYGQSNDTQMSKHLDKSNHKIDVEINRIISDKGIVYFALYDSQDNFINRKPLKVLNKKVENNSVKVIFENLKPGVYAVSCYHDANNNGKMDFENNGMPLEDYGATNNIMNYGPPRFEDSKFELKNKDLTFEIKFQ